MKNILHITPDFNYSCGRSKLVYLYLKYFSSKNDYQAHFITNGGDSLERLNKFSNLKYEILNFSTGIKNVYQARNFYKNIKEYIVENQIILAHTHHRFPEFIVNTIGHRMNVKTVFSTHGFVKGFKSLSFKSDIIISVSNSVSTSLIEEYSINKDRIRTLYNPIENENNRKDVDLITLKKRYSLPNDIRLILYMGRINFIKGYDSLLEAFTKVNEKIKNSFLIISGSDETKKIVYKLCSNIRNVKILQPNYNSIELFALADIVVLPSRSDTFPFVMLETGVFKKPFIGGNTGGIAEFIEDGKNGLLIDPENPEQLAEKILFLLNNQDYGKKLGDNLHEKVTRLCDYNNYFSEVEKIYNSLIAN